MSASTSPCRVREHLGEFRTAHVAHDPDLSWMRLTVDVPADLDARCAAAELAAGVATARILPRSIAAFERRPGTAGSERPAAAQRALPRATRRRSDRASTGTRPLRSRTGGASSATPCSPAPSACSRCSPTSSSSARRAGQLGMGPVWRPHARAGVLGLGGLSHRRRSRPAVRGYPIRRGRRRTRAARTHRRGGELCSRRAVRDGDRRRRHPAHPVIRRHPYLQCRRCGTAERSACPVHAFRRRGALRVTGRLRFSASSRVCSASDG